MADTYTLAHGAKHNVGDFLIRDRATALLEEHAGISPAQLSSIDISHTTISNEELEEIADSKALLIAGGPSIQPDFYPRIYPSMDRLLALGIPIVPLGVGWRGHDENKFTFTDNSKKVLRSIFDRIEAGGVRDLPTKRLLEDIGINNVTLAGCPAWHDLRRDNESFTPPLSINSIVVTSPQKGQVLRGPQWSYLLYRLAREFPGADRYVSYHHGMDHIDGYISKKEMAYNYSIGSIAKILGYEFIDPSGNPDADPDDQSRVLDQYRNIDIHIGYRVHGHIHFLANGQPSYLLCEDGRGFGASESFRTQGADVGATSAKDVKAPVDKIVQNVKRNHRTGYEDFKGVDGAISTARKNMERVLESLP